MYTLIMWFSTGPVRFYRRSLEDINALVLEYEDLTERFTIVKGQLPDDWETRL